MLSEKEDCLMFPLFPSQAVDRTSNEWKDTVADWVEVLGGYEKALEWCASQGAKHYEERHRDRGLLLGISSRVLGANDSEGSSEFVVGSGYPVFRVRLVCGV